MSWEVIGFLKILSEFKDTFEQKKREENEFENSNYSRLIADYTPINKIIDGTILLLTKNLYSRPNKDLQNTTVVIGDRNDCITLNKTGGTSVHISKGRNFIMKNVKIYDDKMHGNVLTCNLISDKPDFNRYNPTAKIFLSKETLFFKKKI